MPADPQPTDRPEDSSEALARVATLPDMSALDAALREVFNASPPDASAALELDQTIEVVSRAASTIDELVERNRSITDAAVRSVEFFRAQAAEARAEVEKLRQELREFRTQAEAQRIAALAQAQELEAELDARAADLAAAQAWIGDLRSHVETMLGDAPDRLAETAEALVLED